MGALTLSKSTSVGLAPSEGEPRLSILPWARAWAGLVPSVRNVPQNVRGPSAAADGESPLTSRGVPVRAMVLATWTTCRPCVLSILSQCGLPT